MTPSEIIETLLVKYNIALHIYYSNGLFMVDGIYEDGVALCSDNQELLAALNDIYKRAAKGDIIVQGGGYD